MILPGTGRGTATEGRGGGGSSLRKPAVYIARKLRRSLSMPEAMLWRELRGEKLGFKIRRQHPVGPYVADFYVAYRRLVIEVDGEGHNRGDRPERDVTREIFLENNGYSVLHVAAADVLRDLESVITGIAARVTGPLHHPADGPPPHAGEDL